jgi:hypothetical protein
VIHERAFAFDLSDGRLEIEDSFVGEGTHALRWHFHFAPGVEVSPRSNGCLELKVAGRDALALTFEPLLAASIADAWFSPSYGVRVPVKAVDLTYRAALGGKRIVRFAIGPAGSS